MFKRKNKREELKTNKVEIPIDLVAYNAIKYVKNKYENMTLEEMLENNIIEHSEIEDFIMSEFEIDIHEVIHTIFDYYIIPTYQNILSGKQKAEKEAKEREKFLNMSQSEQLYEVKKAVEENKITYIPDILVPKK